MKNPELIYCRILGTDINVIDMESTVAYLKSNLESLRGKYICVSNVHTTVMAFRNEEYRNVQNLAAMALPDGKPLSMVSKNRGFQEAKRVPGPDLMPRIFELSKKTGYRHFFYGSKEETLEKMKDNLLKKYPYLQIAGMYAPPFRDLTEEEDQKIIRQINTARPDFIWVALGAPKQEKWMHAHMDKVSGVMLGVGAAFDFTAGTVKRAPKWVQEICLEWFYRILQDPKRLIPRYISTNISFLWNVHKESCKLRKLSKMDKDSLKIAMIGHKRIPTREGGVEIVVSELSTRLVAKGHRVDAYNRRGSHVSGKEFVNRIGKEYEGIRIITVPTFENKSLNAIVYSFLASVRVLFGGYDVIHYHAEGPCAMLWLPKLFGKRVVATIHGLDWQRSKWGNFASKVLKFGEKTASKLADEVIVLSANMQEYFKQTYGRDTVYISNGIVKPKWIEAKEIIKKWNLHKDGYILFLARIVPEKGVHYLIEAYKQLQTDKKLVIAGGSSHSMEYFAQLKDIAGDNENIIFTDFVGGRDLEELFSNAYVFVLPSDVEGMAIALLEAMSYGNCCLISDIPENIEVVEDKAVSFMHSNIPDLQEKLEELLQNPEKVRQYKDEAAEFICRKYNWDQVVDRTVDVYLGRETEC